MLYGGESEVWRHARAQKWNKTWKRNKGNIALLLIIQDTLHYLFYSHCIDSLRKFAKYEGKLDLCILTLKLSTLKSLKVFHRQEVARIRENLNICITVVFIIAVAIIVTSMKIIFYDRCYLLQ